MTRDKRGPNHGKTQSDFFTVAVMKAVFASRTYDISASVESSVRFHSEIFYAKPKESRNIPNNLDGFVSHFKKYTNIPLA